MNRFGCPVFVERPLLLAAYQIAESLALEMGKSIPPQITGMYRQGDIRHCVADITKARSLLAWEPLTSFRQGVPELIEWVQSQRDVHDGVNSAWDELQQRGLVS